MADASAPVNDESVAVTGHLSPKPAAMTAGPLVVESGVASTEDAECHPAGPDAGSSEGNTHQLLRLPSERVYSLVCSWKGQKHEVEVNETDTVGDLKATLYSLTDVPPQRMKLIGLTKKLPGDEVEIASLGLSSGILTKFMMIGTPEGQEHKEQVGPDNRDKEPDIDYSAAQQAAKTAAQSIRNRRKLQEAIGSLTLDIMVAPRPGKKLLVLDLDYCILDCKLWSSSAFVADHFARPFLHDLLKAVAPFYDIVIWSQTSWRFLEQKLMELDIIGESSRGAYPVVTTVDRKPMFTVYGEREKKGSKGEIETYKHEVKALAILWAKFPEHYSKRNTIHVDDLSRNFAMNPANGLLVKAYKDAMTNAATDHELVHVARYLLQLVNVPDFTKLDHHSFKKSKLPLPPGVEDPSNWRRRA